MNESQVLWESVRESVDEAPFTLGPYFGSQANHTPRHLLFTLARYKFAAKMLSPVKELDVLEFGCSEGFGSLVLAENARQYTGVDFDARAVAYAQQSIKNPNMTFKQGDFLLYTQEPVDAVVSLDVIEHIEQRDEDQFCERIADNLKPGGFAVIGTPNITANQYASKPSQVGHVNLFSAERLHTLFSKYFNRVFNFGMNDEVLHTGFHPMCHYIFVLACHKK